MKLNSNWHLSHPMPKHPTLDQRIAWHLAHVEHCGCRDIPAKLVEEMRRRNIRIPQGIRYAHKPLVINLERLESPDAKVKYAFAKELLTIAARSPEVLYPHFHRWQQLLEGDNPILKWTGIDLIGRLAEVDKEGKVDMEIPRLIDLLHGGHLITTSHTIAALGMIARYRPSLRSLILHELMKVSHDAFENAECREIAIGKVVEVLTHFQSEIQESPEAYMLIQHACHSSRKATAKKGEKLRNKLAAAL